MKKTRSSIRFEHVVHRRDAGAHVDDFVCSLLPEAPRLAVRRLIGAGRILLNGKPCVARDRLHVDDMLSGSFPPEELRRIAGRDARAQILHEDALLLVVDKRPGQLMVPGRNPKEDCLRNALREVIGDAIGGMPPEGLDPDEAAVPPWVVHRLDRDTSGLCLWAKTAEAHRELSRQFADREVRKVYLALVAGEPEQDQGVIDLPIGPHPKDPLRMQLTPRGREARTEYRVVERFRGLAWLEVEPKTGRTHQVRLHLKGIGHPLAVDPLYGSARPLMLSDLKAGYREKQGGTERPLLTRTPLHASELRFRHPATGQETEFRSPLPEDLERVRKALLKHRAPGPRAGSETGAESGTGPGRELGAEPSPGAGAEPSPGAGAEPSPGAGAEPSPGAGAEPSPGAGAEPSPGAGAEPSPGAGAEPGQRPDAGHVRQPGSEPNPK